MPKKFAEKSLKANAVVVKMPPPPPADGSPPYLLKVAGETIPFRYLTNGLRALRKRAEKDPTHPGTLVRKVDGVLLAFTRSAVTDHT